MMLGLLGLLGLLGEETRRVCRVCGCTDERACVDDHGNACAWADEEVCTACVAKHGDACWIEPGHWINLRARVQEQCNKVGYRDEPRGDKDLHVVDHPKTEGAMEALEWVMQTMDETLI